MFSGVRMSMGEIPRRRVEVTPKSLELTLTDFPDALIRGRTATVTVGTSEELVPDEAVWASVESSRVGLAEPLPDTGGLVDTVELSGTAFADGDAIGADRLEIIPANSLRVRFEGNTLTLRIRVFLEGALR